MSRTGEKPIDIPSGVTVAVEDSGISVKGPQGELSHHLPDLIKVVLEDNRILVTRADDSRSGRSLHGLTRSLILNMVEGVSKGFSKELAIKGVGFKASLSGRKLMLSLGFSKPVEFVVPNGIKVAPEGGTKIVVSGPDKQQVGDVAARIRSVYPPEPYKGKGIRYSEETVRRKTGKTVA